MFLFKHLLRGREIGVIVFRIRVGDIVVINVLATILARI